MRTPICLVRMHLEHSEQDYDLEYVFILKTHVLPLKNCLCHCLDGGRFFLDIKSTVIDLPLAARPFIAYDEFSTGKTGKTGNALCRNGFRHPGFVFVVTGKPGNREKVHYFRADYSRPDAHPVTATAKKIFNFVHCAVSRLPVFGAALPKTGNVFF